MRILTCYLSPVITIEEIELESGFMEGSAEFDGATSNNGGYGAGGYSTGGSSNLGSYDLP